jgi:hypothetical protein
VNREQKDLVQSSSVPGLERREFCMGGAALCMALTHPALASPARDKRDKTDVHWETHMEIRRVGSQPSAKGPSDWFTGTVRIDPLFTAPDPALIPPPA